MSELNKITNANVYVNGANLVGKAEEVELPKFTWKQDETKGLGLFSMLEFPAGLEKVEAKVKWNSVYKEILRFAMDPFSAMQMQFRSQIDVYNNTTRVREEAVVLYLTCRAKDMQIGTFQHQEGVTTENNLTCTAAKLVIAGEEMFDWDGIANKYVVNGKDIMETFRQNLGL